jgi:hypothetical protein
MSHSISWSLKFLVHLAAILLCMVARAEAGDPPGSNSGQGIFLHGTGRFEHVNIPLASGVLPQEGSQARAQRGPAPALPERGYAFPWTPRINACSLIMDRGELKEVCQNGTRPAQTRAAGLNLKGASFIAPFNGQFVEFTITAVTQRSKSLTGATPPIKGSEFQYQVAWKLQGKGGALCPSRDGLTGLPINRFALAVPGAWSASGELIKTPDYFTFACLPGTAEASSTGGQASQGPPLLLGGGVIAKCIDMGFPPWDDSPSATEQGHAGARDRHQMCVRMATADYCSEGKANTIEGTPITFYDSRINKPLVVQTESNTKGETTLRRALRDQAGNATGYSLEAVWTVDPESGRAYPLCFGEKTRWKTLALEGTCINTTLRQKLAKGGSWSGDLSCEGQPIEQLKKVNPLLVTYSLFIDKPLVRFELGSGSGSSSFVTTSAVTPLMFNSPAMNFRPGFKLNLSVDKAVDQGTLEGPILSAEIASHYQRLGLKPLYRCKQQNGNLYALTDNCSSLKGNYAPEQNRSGGIEGYIFTGKAFADELPLMLWKRLPDNGTYLTSTMPPPKNQGWDEKNPVPLGYLPTMSASRTWVLESLLEHLKSQEAQIPPVTDIPITPPPGGWVPAPRPSP